MTPGQVETLTARVQRAAEDGDAETAHGWEDELHVTVLRAIAAGEVSPDMAPYLALMALSTADTDFPRRSA